QVRGKYGPKAFPAFAVRARVDNGAFKYPDLPLAARAIALDLAATNPGGHVDSTVIDLKSFHAVLGNRPIDASLLVRTPVGDPDATLRLKGSVDLADVARTVKLEGVTTLTGVVAADMSTHARVSDIDAHRYDRVAASGGVQASRVAIRTSSVPHPIAVDTAALAFTPQNARLTTFAAKIGNSDIRANGSLENVLGFLLRNEDLRGSGAVSSNSFDLNEWKSNKKTTEVIPVPPHVDFTLAASAARVLYGALTLTDVKGTLEIKSQRVAMQNLTMQMLHGALTANGYYDTVNPDKPSFSFDIGLTTLDIPAAFTSLALVRQLAPIAKYAQGRLSGKLSLAGPIGRDMSPVLTALAGKGEITTDSLMLHNAPVTQKLSGAFSLGQLASPSIPVLHAAFDLADGRLHVKPFKVGIGGVDLTASGSNGIDQSMTYDLALAVPRNLLGPAATSAIGKLASKAGAAGAQLPAGDVVQLRAKLTGSVTNPSIATDFAGMAASMKDATRAAAQNIAATATATATQKADSAAAAAKAKAAAQAAAIVAQAEKQADSIRATGKALADRMRHETDVRIDSLVGKASNPIAKLAAQKAADRLRSQTNDQADKVVQTANARADSLVSQARQKAGTANP
ncbi:MAG TPA: AsmA-like C-terminal region-containing protein, partial [Gemmatimonadaceae bacterium]|nr:AsmA-like C-terminal region-containing protein [Gemmatimonadaceae bacterium]